MYRHSDKNMLNQNTILKLIKVFTPIYGFMPYEVWDIGAVAACENNMATNSINDVNCNNILDPMSCVRILTGMIKVLSKRT